MSIVSQLDRHHPDIVHIDPVDRPVRWWLSAARHRDRIPSFRGAVRIFSRWRPGIPVLVAVLLGASCASSGLRSATLRVSSPYFPGRYEDHVVRPGERFQIMDLDYKGGIVDFLADFAIDTTAMRAFSISDTLNNPAIKVGIFEGDSLIDTSWAFRVGQFKHASRRASLIFEIVKLSVGKPYVTLPEEEEQGAASEGEKAR